VNQENRKAGKEGLLVSSCVAARQKISQNGHQGTQRVAKLNEQTFVFLYARNSFLLSCFPDSAFSSSSRSLNCRAHFRSFSHRARNQVITTRMANPIFQTVSIAVLFEQRRSALGCRNKMRFAISFRGEENPQRFAAWMV
jgi:hypothetical protein